LTEQCLPWFLNRVRQLGVCESIRSVLALGDGEGNKVFDGCLLARIRAVLGYPNEVVGHSSVPLVALKRDFRWLD
jgi:hypothetical protein